MSQRERGPGRSRETANIPDLYRLARLRGDWLGTLKETKDRKRSEDKIEDDVQALARLQWMNEKMSSSETLYRC